MHSDNVYPSPVSFWVNGSPEEVSARLIRGLRSAGATMAGAVSGGRAEFYLPRVLNAARSAQLSVELETAEGGTWVHGRFIQHPYVWIQALLALVVSVFGGMLALGYAYAEWCMGLPPHALWGVLFSLGVGMLALRVARHGARAGTHRTDELTRFVEDSLRPPPGRPAVSE